MLYLLARQLMELYSAKTALSFLLLQILFFQQMFKQSDHLCENQLKGINVMLGLKFVFVYYYDYG